MARRLRSKREIQLLFGDEPSWNEDADLRAELQKAYQWYSDAQDRKNGIKFLNTWASANLSEYDAAAIHRTRDRMIPLNLCWIARILTRNLAVPDETKKYFLEQIEELVEKATDVEEEDDSPDDEPRADKSVLRARALISEFDIRIDIYTNTFEVGERPYEFFMKNQVNSKQARYLIEHYTPWIKELQELVEQKTEDLIEAYSCYTRRQHKKLFEFAQGVINDLNLVISAKKAARKPRARKARNENDLVKNLKYLQADDALKLTSIDPIQIIGAKRLVVYNVENRNVTIYESQEGLSVKGTTLLNVDEEKSAAKKLRKPEEQISGFVNQGKLSVKKTFDGIRTASKKPRARLNDRTLILSAYK